MVRYDICFVGRVQGVGFRATARDIAGRHTRVAGWVRNEPDGGVRMVIEGAPEDLDRYLADLRSAMAGNIERVDVSTRERSEASPAAALRGFEIRH